MNLNKIILTSLAAIITATSAFAAGENVVASKHYVDTELETKQPMIPALAEAMEFTPGYVLMPSAENDGQLGLRFIIPGLDEMPDLSGSGQGIADVRNWWLFGGEISESNVTAILDDISRQFTNSRWIDGGGIGMTLQDVLYSPASLKLVSDVWNESQRTITGHAANAADSILTDSATNGVVQKRAIFDGSATYAAGTHANQIPTMGAVMSAITNGTPKITWSATQTAAVNNYSTTFDGTANNWVATDSGKLVDGAVIANALALKQNKIAATTTNYTYDATNRPNADGSLVATTTTAGTVTERPIVNAATYDSTTGALTNGSAIPNVTALDTRQKKKVCAGWPDSVAVADRSDANCWLWYFPD